MVTYNPVNAVYEVSSFSPRISAGFATANSPDLSHIDNVDKYIQMNQVHGTNISLLTAHNLQATGREVTIQGVDGLITSQKGVMLIVRTADCVPILYEDDTSHLIGASHQGWKGTYLNMASHMIQRMIGLGAEVDSIRVAIGPSIGPCCYKIFGARKDIIFQLYPDYADQLFETQEDGTGLNIMKLNYLQLLAEGVLPENITYVLNCTRCNSMFHSFQREAVRTSQFSFIVKHD